MIEKSRHQKAQERDAVEGTRNRAVYSPLTDIYETKNALVLLLEMPSVDATGVKVTLDKRVLTITGICTPVVPKGYSLSAAEYRDGDYERSFTLAENIDGDGIEAVLRDGLLRLTLPKARPAPAKTISVEGG